MNDFKESRRTFSPVYLIPFVLIAILVIGLLFVPMSPPASAKHGTCPESSYIPGLCLTDQNNLIRIENIPVPDSQTGALHVDPLWTEDRWLVTIRNTVPFTAILPFGLNMNKFHVELVAVFADQRQLKDVVDNEGDFFDTLYIRTRLVCDPTGSRSPTLSFSMPRQTIMLSNGTLYHRMPRNLYFNTVNWWEALTRPCEY